MQFGLKRLVAGLPLAGFIGMSGCGGGMGAGGPALGNPPAGFAYVTVTAADAGALGSVYEYAVREDGSVAPLAQVSVNAGVRPGAVALANGHVYVVNAGDDTISQYNIEADHSLSPMNPPTVINPGMKTPGVMPGAVTVDPTGSYLYVANSGDDTLSQFSIGSTGGLTPLSPATVAAGPVPVSLAAQGGTGGGHLYVVNSGAGVPAALGSVSQYSISADGTLAALDPATVPANASPVAIAIDQGIAPQGAAFVMSNCGGSSCSGSIAQFAVGAGGELTPTGLVVNTGDHYNAIGMVTDPSGANAYVLTNLMGVDTNNGALWQFSVANTGALSPSSPPTLSMGPEALAQALFDDRLCVLTSNVGSGGNAGSGGSIDCYTLGPGGQPTLAASTTLTAARPVSMAMLFLNPP